MNDDFPGMGHNLGGSSLPSPEELRLELLERHADLTRRKKELLDSGASWTKVETEEQAKAMSDMLAMFRAALKSVKAAFEEEKSVYLELGRVCDGVFTADLKTPLEKEGQRLRGLELDYMKAKEAAERAAREEVARLAREEANRKLREAEEAEAARQQALALAEPHTPEPSVAPAAQAMAVAIAADDSAGKAEKAALAKPAELGRVRGNMGSISTIRRRWTGTVTDRDICDLEALRKHLPQDALDQAARALAKAECSNGKPVPTYQGIRLWEETY